MSTVEPDQEARQHARQEARRRAQLVDLALAGVLLVIGAALLVGVSGLRGGNPADPLGPRGFPTLLTVGILVTGLVLAIKSAVALRHPDAFGAMAGTHEAQDNSEDMGPVSHMRLALGSLGIILYAVLLPVAGFLVTSFLFIVGMIYVQGGAALRSVVVTSLGFPIALYLLLSTFLGISLPNGFFDPSSLLGGR